jgi:hypothetical protein
MVAVEQQRFPVRKPIVDDFSQCGRHLGRKTALKVVPKSNAARAAGNRSEL